MKRVSGTLFDDKIKKTKDELLKAIAEAKAKLQQPHDDSDIQVSDESTSSPKC